MKNTIPLIALALTLVTGCSLLPDGGWTTLFDGSSLNGWHPYGQPVGTPIPEGWEVKDGLLHKVPGVRGGNIITLDKYTDFELYWEWKLAPNANNGVKYLVTEARPKAPGYEYQMIDDNGPRWSKLHDSSKTASFYAVLPPDKDKPLKPAGEWNTSRIVVMGNYCEHWLNGKKVLEYELGGAAVKAGVAASKFKDYPDFGTKLSGYIMLTDHNDECWYRVIKIRELTVPQ